VDGDEGHPDQEGVIKRIIRCLFGAEEVKERYVDGLRIEVEVNFSNDMKISEFDAEKIKGAIAHRLAERPFDIGLSFGNASGNNLHIQFTPTN
jgi:hypothetical protein